jgi:hypothetical protein
MIASLHVNSEMKLVLGEKATISRLGHVVMLLPGPCALLTGVPKAGRGKTPLETAIGAAGPAARRRAKSMIAACEARERLARA